MARTKHNYTVGEEITAVVTLDEYCRHLTVKLAGEELGKAIARETENRKKNGWDVTLVDKKERYETTFRNVQPNKKGAEPTEAEKDLFAKIFKTKDDVLSLTVKRSNCPRFFVKTSDGKLRKLDLDGKSLTGGQTATAVWRVYETANSYGPQIGFEGLIFDEEPKLWTPGPQAFGGYTVEPSAPAAEPTATTEAAPAAAEAPAAEAKPAAFSWN